MKFRGNLQVKVWNRFCGCKINGAVQNGVNDSPGILYGDSLAGTVPPGIHQVDLGARTFQFLFQEFCVLKQIPWHKWKSVAGGKIRLRLSDSNFGAGKFRGVSHKKMVHRLFRGKT